MKPLHQERFALRVQDTPSILELVPKRRTVRYLSVGACVLVAMAAVVAIRGWGAGVIAGASSFLVLFMAFRHHESSRRRIVFDKEKARLFIGDVVTGQDSFRSATQAAEQIPIADIRALEVLSGGYGGDSWSELNVIRRDERRVHLFAADSNTVKSAAHQIGEEFNLPVTSAS